MAKLFAALAVSAINVASAGYVRENFYSAAGCADADLIPGRYNDVSEGRCMSLGGQYMDLMCVKALGGLAYQFYNDAACTDAKSPPDSKAAGKEFSCNQRGSEWVKKVCDYDVTAYHVEHRMYEDSACAGDPKMQTDAQGKGYTPGCADLGEDSGRYQAPILSRHVVVEAANGGYNMNVTEYASRNCTGTVLSRDVFLAAGCTASRDDAACTKVDTPGPFHHGEGNKDLYMKAGCVKTFLTPPGSTTTSASGGDSGGSSGSTTGAASPNAGTTADTAADQVPGFLAPVLASLLLATGSF